MPRCTLRIQTESKSTKFGLTNDEVYEASNLLKNFGIKVFGIHAYLGKEKFNAEKINEIVNLANKLINSKICENNLFLGPGLPGLDQEEFIFNELKKIQKIKNINLHIECGRAIFESCGLYAAEIISIKKRDLKTIVIINGGQQHFAEKLISETGEENIYSPMLYRNGKYIEDERVAFILYGNQCNERDMLHPSIMLPKDIQLGDWLIFPNRGAYGITASNNQFIGLDMAEEYLLENNQLNSIGPTEWRTYQEAVKLRRD